MPKIHNVEWSLNPVSKNDRFMLDLSWELTSQLQRMVRQCQIFNLTGMQVTALSESGETGRDGIVGGKVRFFQPTAGRIRAIKNAFYSVWERRKESGYRSNYEYDFRVGLDAGAGYVVSDHGSGIYAGNVPIPNHAVNYARGAPYSLWLVDSSVTGTDPDYNSIFRMYNLNIPDYTKSSEAPYTGVLGWDGALGTVTAVGVGQGIDYMQHETNALVTNPFGPKAAHEELAGIPFATAISNTGYGSTVDPWAMPLHGNQFFQILNGLIEISIEDCPNDETLQLKVSCQVLGWKSYMKKRRKSRKSKRRGKK